MRDFTDRLGQLQVRSFQPTARPGSGATTRGELQSNSAGGLMMPAPAALLPWPPPTLTPPLKGEGTRSLDVQKVSGRQGPGDRGLGPSHVPIERYPSGWLGPSGTPGPLASYPDRGAIHRMRWGY